MPEQERPSRKPNRLHSYDYSSIGTYFITICTIGRQPLLWNSTVGALTERPRIQLSAYGEIADNAIHAITQHYPAVSVDRYTIMSDHIHLLLRITDEGGRSVSAPTVSTVIRHLKATVSRRCKEKIWQKGFYDHIIRNPKDYEETAIYIANNLELWIQKHYCN